MLQKTIKIIRKVQKFISTFHAKSEEKNGSEKTRGESGKKVKKEKKEKKKEKGRAFLTCIP